MADSRVNVTITTGEEPMATRKFTTEIEELLVQINLSIHYLTIDAENDGIAVYEMKLPDDSLSIERLLLAKAYTINTIAIINSQENMLVKNQNMFEKEMYDPDLRIQQTPIESYQSYVREAIRLRNEQIWGK